MDEWEIKELAEEALWAVRDGQYVRATALADQLATAVPEDPVARAIRAQALLPPEADAEAGESAVNEARRAVELAPDNEFAHVTLGIAAWRSNRLTLAQHSMERAIEISDRKPRLLVDYAWFMAFERGPRLALEAAEEAVAAAPDASTAWAALGLAQFRLHRRDDADESLQRALGLDPNDFYAQWVKVILLQDRSQDAEAEALMKILEETPGTEQLVARVRREAKRRQVAKRLVEREALPDAVVDVSFRRWTWRLLALLVTAAAWFALIAWGFYQVVR